MSDNEYASNLYYIEAREHFDRIYERYDLSVPNFILWLHPYHAEDLLSLKDMYGIAYRLKERYPRKDRPFYGYDSEAERKSWRPLRDTNDYELLADYSREC